MVETRLRRRLRLRNMACFSEYLEFVFSAAGAEEELVPMIDAITTNKTDFFREPAHFDFLVKTALPDLVVNHGSGTQRPLVLWSAGCSTGEEPYTLAIVLNEFGRLYPGITFNFLILATDLSTRVLEKAASGTYTDNQIDVVPLDLRRKYFLRSKDRMKGLVRIVPELRRQVRFRRLNLMTNDFGFREPIDIIFCRNVMIYFDRQTQKHLVNHFYDTLRPGGYFFQGHSESLNGLDSSFINVAPTIYRRP
jgi:chemotaxis protein methyltransferase CheR